MVIDLHGPGLWYATRAAGLVTLLLLTASVLLGVMTAGRFSSERWPRFLTSGLHRNISLLVLVFLVLHAGTTMLDEFVSIPVIAVFVPLAASYKTFWLGLDAFVPIRVLRVSGPPAASYKPFWLGLGAVASDLLLAWLLTSLLRSRLGYRPWRWVHWLAYACWPVGWHTAWASARTGPRS